MLVRRIQNFKDIENIYNGIMYGIKHECFSEQKLTDLIQQITSENHTFFIFYETGKYGHGEYEIPFGFGCVAGDHIQKVFVYPTVRRKGYGTRISLWLANWILRNHGQVPQMVIKDKNSYWQKEQIKHGYLEKVKYWEPNCKKYVLVDFIKFGEALKKYKINEIKMVKEKKVI
mgnify:CR=1 FL=1